MPVENSHRTIRTSNCRRAAIPVGGDAGRYSVISYVVTVRIPRTVPDTVDTSVTHHSWNVAGTIARQVTTCSPVDIVNPFTVGFHIAVHKMPSLVGELSKKWPPSRR